MQKIEHGFYAIVGVGALDDPLQNENLAQNPVNECMNFSVLAIQISFVFRTVEDACHYYLVSTKT